MSETLYVHQAIARSINHHKIDTMFGIMGDANLFMINDFVESCGASYVPAAFEGSAVLMAIAYAHASSKIGVATVTHGPGLTNCVTALTEGVRARQSIVLLCGDTSVSNHLGLQNIDQREVVKATGAGFEQLRSPETTIEDVANSFYRAKKEKRPIVLNMPIDFMWEKAQYHPTIKPVFKSEALVSSGDLFDQALGMIMSSKRPLILAGIGAIKAEDSLVKLADRLDAVLATTLKGNGLFTNHPKNIGICGTLSNAVAYEVISKSDCIVSFGASLHSFTTDKGKLFNGKRVIQISDDADDIGRTFLPDAALISDPKLAADNIIYWLNEAETSKTGFSKELKKNGPSQVHTHKIRSLSDGYIDFCFALDRLDEILPKDRILVTDGGRFMTEVWCRVSAPDPLSFIHSANFAAIGQGLQQAIGAAHAKPDKTICLFIGDGGFMLGGINEFNTAVRTKANLQVIVCNDSAYGAEHIQFRDRQMSPAISEFEWPSFANMAKAMGGNGFTVASNEDLELAFKSIRFQTGPNLIELKLDPNQMPRMRR